MESTERYRLLQPGEMLNWYRIERVLGRGGFGVIYLATDTNLDHAVAIKEFAPGDVTPARTDGLTTGNPSDPADLHRWGLERFLREARNLVKFKHPNIVRVISVFEQNDTAYLVMEFEQGQDLRTWFAYRENTGEAALKSLIAPVAQGLAAVHRRGFIHRDIKPSNILVRDDGSPVLLDFGSARETARVADSAFTALVSVGFAPLEQYSSDSDQQQGPWTDIYALGGVLYTAVCGCDPVDSTRRAAALFNGSRDPLIAARSLAEGRYNDHFLRAIDWALAFRVADRPQSLGDWLPALLADPDGHEPAPSADAVSAWLERGRRESGLASLDIESDTARSIGETMPDVADVAARRADRSARAARHPSPVIDVVSRRPATRRPSTRRPIGHSRRLVGPDDEPFDDTDEPIRPGTTGRPFREVPPPRHRFSPLRFGSRPRLRSSTTRQRGFRRVLLPVLTVLLVVWGVDRWEDRQEHVANRERLRAEAERELAEQASPRTPETIAVAPMGDVRSGMPTNDAGEVPASRGDGRSESTDPKETPGRTADGTPATSSDETSDTLATTAPADRPNGEPVRGDETDRSTDSTSTGTVSSGSSGAVVPDSPRPSMTAAERRAAERLAATLRAEAKEQAAAEARRAQRARQVERDAAEAAIDRALDAGDIDAARAALAAASRLGVGRDRIAQLEQRIDLRESARGGPLSDREVDEVVRRFDALARAIESGDAAAMNALTEGSDQNELFEQLFTRFERISIDIAAVRVRNADRTVSGTLRIENMERSAGGVATPSERYRDRTISSRRIDDEWSPIIW